MQKTILDRIKSPADLRKLTLEEQRVLAPISGVSY